MKDYLIYLQMAVILVLSVMLHRSCEDKPEPQSYDYNPTIIEMPKFEMPEFKGFEVSPHITFEYSDYDREPNVLECHEDSLLQVIRELERDTLAIQPEFLTQFPESPKLITLAVDSDSLTLTLFDIDARLRSLRYPVDFNYYKYGITTTPTYQFKVDEVGLSDFNSRQKPNPWSLYVMAGYDVTFSSGLLGMDFGYTIGDWRFSARPELFARKEPQLRIGITAGYNLLNGR